jgi:hypothetical protein
MMSEKGLTFLAGTAVFAVPKGYGMLVFQGFPKEKLRRGIRVSLIALGLGWAELSWAAKDERKSVRGSKMDGSCVE